MHEDIAKRLHQVYPSGDFDAPDTDALYAADYITSVRKVVESMCVDYAMQANFDLHADTDRTRCFAITERARPSQVEWCWDYNNPDKLAWIAKHGRPFPILWLKVSRVFPAYWFYYNLWTPRGDTGYLDAVIDYSPPTPTWAALHPALHTALHATGLQLLDDAAASEQVPFVLEEVFEDDKGNDLPDDAPPRRLVVNVHQALFPIVR